MKFVIIFQHPKLTTIRKVEIIAISAALALELAIKQELALYPESAWTIAAIRPKHSKPFAIEG